MYYQSSVFDNNSNMLILGYNVLKTTCPARPVVGGLHLMVPTSCSVIRTALNNFILNTTQTFMNNLTFLQKIHKILNINW